MSSYTKSPKLLTDYLQESLSTCLNNITFKMMNTDTEETSIFAYLFFSSEWLNFLPCVYKTQVT